MRKIVAFLMAFALCVMCFGTYGFADLDSDAHNHVVHALDNDDLYTEYLYINQKSSQALYSETQAKLRVTLVFDSESLEKGSQGVLTITAPYYVLGAPTVVTGNVFGDVDPEVTVTATKPAATATSQIKFTMSSAEAGAGFSQTGHVTIDYPVDVEFAKLYNGLRTIHITVNATVVTTGGDTIRIDPSASTYTVYACSHIKTEDRVTKAATCTESGEKETICTSCDKVISKETIQRTNHNFDYSKPYNVNIFPVTLPTCSSTGSGCFKCIDCETIVSGTMPKLDHDYSKRVLVSGVYYDECKNCGNRQKSENQCTHPTENYVFVSTTTASTCVQKGTARYQCPTCKSYEDRELPLAAHTYNAQGVVTKQATCFVAGEMTNTCRVCKQTVKEAIEPLGHSYGEWRTVVEPTCDKNGKQVRSCIRCSTQEEKVIQSSTHTYGGWVVKTASTCIVPGVEARTCGGCHKEETRALSLAAHTYGEWKESTPATCVATGIEVRSCVVCGKAESQVSALNPNNHAFGEWTVSVAKGCIKDGELSRACVNCQKTETKVDPFVGHTFGAPVENDDTTTKTCEKCGYQDVTVTVKGGTEKNLVVTPGTLILSGAESGKDYTFVFGAPDVETEAGYKKIPELQNYYKAYNVSLLNGHDEVSMNASMQLSIKTEAVLDEYEISIIRLVDNALYPVNNFEREDGEIIIPGNELTNADVVFIMRGEERAPNLLVPIIVTVVVVVVAAAAVVIIMIKSRKRYEYE